MAHDDGDVEADIYYLSRSDVYKSVKPYTLRYKPPGSLPITNVIREQKATIIRNMRQHPETLQYDKCGFQFAILDTQMTWEDFSDVDKIDQVHRPEIEQCVKEKLQASSVQVLDYVVGFVFVSHSENLSHLRGRYEGVMHHFPLLLESRMNGSSQPQGRTLVKHYVGTASFEANKLDFTFNAGVSTIRNAFPEKADEILAAGWQFVK